MRNGEYQMNSTVTSSALLHENFCLDKDNLVSDYSVRPHPNYVLSQIEFIYNITE